MKTRIIISLLMSFLSANSIAISVDQLKEKFDRNERVVVIDLRTNLEYQNNHIVGAINIPFKILSNKKFPPFSAVVIYDAGLLSDDAKNAKLIFEEKTGADVEILEGGFEAWQSVQKNRISKSSGLELPEITTVNYQQLIEIDKNISVSKTIIDIRKSVEKESIKLHFNNYSIIEAPMPVYDEVISKEIWNELSIDLQNKQNVVVVGDGDHIADRLAVYLSGNKNIIVLLLGGGEKSLSVKGEIKQKSRTDGVSYE
ncbi:rhodanese-like domain-containing protein [Marinicellulosiphila megalodicopiae]|uniref:rhodanese-like domain-containing protein n=1 Tax=Marinicellulosiphila megalodicopiae TaxID=2724896 RepID=UPI003BB0F671